MTSGEFFQQLESRIAKYDLLCHPFYKAWSAGELTRDDLREYASDYFHHVKAFPSCLAAFGVRLDECELRQTVLANMSDELGLDASGSGRSHADIWLDFAEGMDAGQESRCAKPLPAIRQLITHFHRAASEGTPAEALASFYAYESQVPRIAKEKERGLRAQYGADDKTCAYFTLHASADVYHSLAWLQQLQREVEANPAAASQALDAAESAARALWRALDGIDARRAARAA